jgi:hypothetical protein
MPARQRFCRVCGQPFRTTRLDAETCSTTCRTRRRRGGDLAYLSSLPADQAQARRFVHEAQRDLIVTTKAVAKSRQEGRGQRRKLVSQGDRDSHRKPGAEARFDT